ncbi:glucosamine-6-phosphate deaminase [Pseudopedobacter beijingensis]|uniref:Glucosamine-6-phosphate deaminase n=1 Tax=Pseudopedobacter beijingensis TaxID=1207056 RepID=A0ABW4IJ51_9SPHI
MKNLQKDLLKIRVFENRTELGEDAASLVAKEITELLKTESYINMIFAAAPSQNDFFEKIVQKDINWERINAFHMDEYVGLPEDAPQGFGNFLKDKIFSKVKFKTVNYINGQAENIEDECVRYENLLKQFPPHIVCMGIGENTHIAFNDPHVADFNDSKLVKVVDLDDACRTQQVNDGCFKVIDSVPKYALTLTVPALFKGEKIFCMVPGKTKANAIKLTLTSEIKQEYPSTILRNHKNAMLFVDDDSYSLMS